MDENGAEDLHEEGESMKLLRRMGAWMPECRAGQEYVRTMNSGTPGMAARTQDTAPAP